MRAVFDAVFVGGGLSTALSVLALLERNPHARLAVVERGAQLGGNHTWCFHAADVPAAAAPLVSSLEVARWSGYTVKFPRRTRRVASSYACVTSERLHEVVSARLAQAPNCALLLASHAVQLEANRVRLRDGRELRAPLVVDATGPTEHEVADAGYQKFVGLEMCVEGGDYPSEPLLFDACIPQYDGFRFMYLLPISRRRLLVEETFFSDCPQLDEERSVAAILGYVAGLGMRVREVHRVERGVLPMPWRDPDIDPAARPLRAGYRAGLFHPVTGYSFPLAIRFALALAQSDLTQLAPSPVAELARSHAAQRPFLRLLTRMLFTCFAPDERFSVLEHFYRLPEPVIERFYAAELTALDRARIFWGAPPRGFSLTRALRHHRHSGAAP
jgi:lycopene beta-cyclase